MLQYFLIKAFGYYLQKYEEPRPYIDCVKTIDALLRHYNPEFLCDVGANSGSWAYTLAMLGQRKLKHVAFFEPQKKYQDVLENIDLRQAERVIFPIGLGNETKELEIKGGNACASFLNFNEDLKTEFTGHLLPEKEMVQIKLLDDVYQENKNLPRPDLIKIDVQGLELQVLKGSKNLLQETKFVVIELSFKEFYKGQDPLWKILQFMDEHHFCLIDFGFEWREEYDPDKKLVQIDAIFENMKNEN